MERSRSSEAAISAVIGSIAILGVAAAGIGVAMIVGTPVLQTVQDQGSAQNVVGQLDSVRYEENRLALDGTSVALGLDPLDGSFQVGQGTLYFMLVFHDDPAFEAAGSYDAPCDLSLSGWLDGDKNLTFDFTGQDTSQKTDDYCRQLYFDGYKITCVNVDNPDWEPGNGQPKKIDQCTTAPKNACGGGETHQMCISIYNATSMEEVSDPTSCGGNKSPGNPTHTQTINEARCNNGTFGATVNLTTDQDWIVRFTDGADTIFVEAFLLHTERLSWTKGSSEVVYESGAVFARDSSGTYLAASPPIHDLTDDFAWRLPTWQGSDSAAFAGNAQTLQVEYDGTSYLVDATANRLRLDFSGDLAAAWCNTFLARNAQIGAEDYWEGSGASCSTPASDGTHGLFYDPDGPAMGEFELSILQQVLAARVRG